MHRLVMPKPPRTEGARLEDTKVCLSFKLIDGIATTPQAEMKKTNSQQQ